MKKIDITSERYRTYVYDNGVHFTITKPKDLYIAESGGHRVTGHDNKAYVINANWLAIEIHEEDLTF